MAKIIITGAAGFIGYHLIKKIINKNIQGEKKINRLII